MMKGWEPVEYAFFSRDRYQMATITVPAWVAKELDEQQRLKFADRCRLAARLFLRGVR